MEGQNELGVRKLKKLRSSVKCSITKRIEKLKKEMKEIQTIATIEFFRKRTKEIEHYDSDTWKHMDESQFDQDQEEIMEKCIEFKEQFENTIDKNITIPTVSKHQLRHYLRSMLRGEAARATEGIPMDAASYSTTKDILEKYFGNRKIYNSKYASEQYSIFFIGN
ncbi:hypothetical protein SNEBB_008565 [Seison nebaliae]|nr:hypothetical protein SNEBB_008565 [Seison nebaliae]